MKRVLFAVFFAFFVLNVQASPQEPLIDPYEESIGMIPDVTVTVPKVKKALVAAAYKLGWVVEEQKNGILLATLSVRAHRLVIEVQYDANRLVARYKDSTNLNYEVSNRGPQIHPSYHRWLKNLFKDTRGYLAMSQN